MLRRFSFVFSVLFLLVLLTQAGCRRHDPLGNGERNTPGAPGSSPKRVVAPSEEPTPITPGLFEAGGATAVAAKYRERIGGRVRALELALYPTYAFLEAQDPKQKENVDRYPFRNGVVGESEPVRVMGPGKLEDSLFSLEEVDLSVVPRIVADAQAELAIADGHVSHVLLERDLPFRKEVRFTVYVSSPRKSGFVEYDVHSKRTKVSKS
jgi:hypothetical protein